VERLGEVRLVEGGVVKDNVYQLVECVYTFFCPDEGVILLCEGY
jgi:hypothetical protein